MVVACEARSNASILQLAHPVAKGDEIATEWSKPTVTLLDNQVAQVE